jgi:quinolinate synthase
MEPRVLDTPATRRAPPFPLPELYARVERHVPRFEWPTMADDIAAILKLKREKNAVILAHNYQTPDIFHTVGDIVGDSLALAREAARTDADVIVLAGVHFMAETAKLLNPGKTVLIPDLEAGCSLAASITAADCCTSGNARKIIEALGVPKVIMLPDEYLAQNIAAQTNVEIIAWKGHCEVHERFTPEDIRSLRETHPGITILAHPECPPEVVAECDFAGSTAAMADYVGQKRPARVVLLTECSMSDNVALQYPDLDFIRPCNLCPHMKRITLKNIRHALETMTHEVTIAPEIADRARHAVERMLAIG